MAPERKKITLYAILSGVGFSGLTWGLAIIFNTGGFVKETKAANSTLEQHISEDKAKDNSNQAFQNNTLLKIENLTVSVSFLAKEIERKNNLEEKYHNQHK